MSNRSRLLVGLVLLAATLIACGGDDVVVSTGPAAPGSPTSSEAPVDDRPVAPEFTLTLQPEGEFTLSEAGKPVYLVFWAEW